MGILGQQFFTPGNDIRCARMWDQLGFEGNNFTFLIYQSNQNIIIILGNNVDCDQNERKTNLGGMDCKAESVIIRNGCTLTVYDKTGCKRTIERSSSCLWGVSHVIIYQGWAKYSILSFPGVEHPQKDENLPRKGDNGSKIRVY